MSELLERASPPQSVAAQTKYRVLFLSADGRIKAAECLSADSDASALSLVRAMVDGHAVELWDGLRFVEHLPCPG